MNKYVVKYDYSCKCEVGLNKNIQNLDIAMRLFKFFII